MVSLDPRCGGGTTARAGKDRSGNESVATLWDLRGDEDGSRSRGPSKGAALYACLDFAKNTVASGNPAPICIGHRRGAIISASIYAEGKA